MTQTDAQSDSEEGLTREEMQQEEEDEPPSKRAKQDAFAKLMAPKPKTIISPKPPSSRPHLFRNRMALGAYIASPESYPASVVIYYNADFVVIHDKFPKATVHTLLLPRSPKHTLLHPFEALQDVEFLEKVKEEVGRLKVLVAAELQRRLGSFSRSDAAREAVLNGDAEPEEAEDGQDETAEKDKGKEPQLPPGRDWMADLMCGVHAVPSMGNLHIHVLSRDMHSPAMKQEQNVYFLTPSDIRRTVYRPCPKAQMLPFSLIQQDVATENHLLWLSITSPARASSPKSCSP